MIRLTRLNDKNFFLNQDLIEFIEETPDTVLTLLSGKKVVVLEKAEAIIDLIIDFRKRTYVERPYIASRNHEEACEQLPLLPSQKR